MEGPVFQNGPDDDQDGCDASRDQRPIGFQYERNRQGLYDRAEISRMSDKAVRAGITDGVYPFPDPNDGGEMRVDDHGPAE